VTLWRRILQGMTALSLDMVISNLAAVLGAALVFRYLNLPTYGQLTLMLSLYTAATIFLNFGLGDVFTAEIARSRGNGNLARVRFLLSRFLYLNVITGVLLFAVFVGMGVRYNDPLWLAMGTYLLTTALNGVANVMFHSYTRYRRLAAQSIARSLFRLLLLAALPFWWRGEALVGVAWTYPLMDFAALLVSVWLARIVWRDLRGVRTDDYSLDSLAVLFRQQGVYAILIISVKKIAGQLPVWILKILTSDVEVGIFGAACQAQALIYAFFSTLETTIFPLVSEQIEADKERLGIALRQMQKFAFWLGLAAVTVGGLTAQWLVVIIAGDKEYLVVVPLFRLWLWRLPINAFSQSHRPLYYALGQQKWLLMIYVGSTLVRFLILIVGIEMLGVIGAVWALLADLTFTVVVRSLVLRRLSPELWVSPLSVFRIEAFDRRLWRMLKP
jgi:O-antigen/teichoic acid export membrane protein